MRLTSLVLCPEGRQVTSVVEWMGIALIEEEIGRHSRISSSPNDLCTNELKRYVAQKFSAFTQPGRQIRRLDPDPTAYRQRSQY